MMDVMDLLFLIFPKVMMMKNHHVKVAILHQARNKWHFNHYRCMVHELEWKKQKLKRQVIIVYHLHFHPQVKTQPLHPLQTNQQQQQQRNRGRRSLPPLRSSRPRRISRHNPQTLRFLPHGPRRNHTRRPHSPPHRLPTRSTRPRCRLPPPPLSVPRQIQIQRDVVHPHPPRLLHQTRRLCGSHSCACHSESRCLCRAGSEREHTAAFGMPQSIFFPGSHSLHCGASSCCT
mmetsp:Transcript_26415/g.35192  ORF Transcript_26415/g.35192 Transcript_26415/m.35192 type:complete len:231 (+) Transcript_26415:1191-1883(+)